MKKIVLVFSIMLVVGTSCKKSNLRCKEAICTMEMRTIGVVLKNGQPIPPAIDYVETIHKGKRIHTDTGYLEGDNIWVSIVNDGHRSQLDLNKPETLTFKVYQQGVVTQEKTMVILADCCHVNKVSGPDTLLIQ